ncbi:MAG: hypothetical protein U5R31_05320 [Acidimicrobiia bacterium]|nr:hypothetical protein [Acidimicrobiia bacterium]
MVLGGIIPDQDREQLAEAGVAAILTPGAPEREVVDAVRHAIDAGAPPGPAEPPGG